jgi:hypothetical protein
MLVWSHLIWFGSALFPTPMYFTFILMYLV